MSAARRRAFITDHTTIASPPLVPEIRLHLVTEMTPLWSATESFLQHSALPPPFWAFSWPGGQALARYILDRPALVAGKRVLDFGAGCAVAAIAAAMAGAGEASACDIDPFAQTAAALNGTLNGVAITGRDDGAALRKGGWDVILVGDMCYEQEASAALIAWLGETRADLILLGDPGRRFVPAGGLERCADYRVPTSLELEDRAEMTACVWRLTRAKTARHA